ncbi:DUF192 domain-containing protein [Mesorhizobium sp. 1B3]|uniref:DUF192 domain-containing protein n=1 Tax=Mesorhizobium sp. 1B3 TaxID=3243599 RepID=UPI003D97CE32
MSRYSWLIASIFLAVSSVSFSGVPTAAADNRAMMLPVDPVPLVAETSGGNRSFRIEIADDPLERQRGLMFRDEMDDTRGMLFVFEETSEVGFWMKNTPLPLDLIFIGEDGRVRAVLPGESFSEAVISPGVPVRFVLEVKAGIAEKAGVEEGDRIRHPAVDRIAGN